MCLFVVFLCMFAGPIKGKSRRSNVLLIRLILLVVRPANRQENTAMEDSIHANKRVAKQTNGHTALNMQQSVVARLIEKFSGNRPTFGEEYKVDHPPASNILLCDLLHLNWW